MSKTNLKPIAAAIGAAVVASLSGATALAEDPFEARDVEPVYNLLADAHGGEGKCGEGKCGEGEGEGKCGEGEGKCGEGEGKCGEDKDDSDGDAESDSGDSTEE